MPGSEREQRRCSDACAALSTGALALLLLGALGAAALGCGAIDPNAVDRPPQESADVRVPAPASSSTAHSAPAAVCAEPAPLLVHHDRGGRVDRVHATLTARGRRGPFLVDTGSRTSFATHEGDEEPRSANTVIACRETSLPIIARIRPGTTPDGQPQAGVLGADLVAHGAVLDLDLARRTLLWIPPELPPPIVPSSVVLPIELRSGWLVASGIRLGGRDVKLIVDTGASNVIIVSQEPRPGEIREETVDGTAAPITLYRGTGELAFAGGPAREVPVDRSDSFATLESLIAQLGGDVDGLLGMSSLGVDRVVIGSESMTIVLPLAVSPTGR
jgi:hypothetical protein